MEFPDEPSVLARYAYPAPVWKFVNRESAWKFPLRTQSAEETVPSTPPLRMSSAALRNSRGSSGSMLGRRLGARSMVNDLVRCGAGVYHISKVVTLIDRDCEEDNVFAK